MALHGAAQTPLTEKHSEQSHHFFFFSSASCLLVFYLRAEQKSTWGWQMHGPTHNNTHSFQIQGDYIFTPNQLQAGLY